MKRSSRSTPAPGDCRAQLDALFAYLDDELTPARRRTIEAHLRDCGCCGHLTDDLKRAVALCRAQDRGVPRSVRARAVRHARQIAAAASSPRTRTDPRRTR